jgi:hypothetical protein
MRKATVISPYILEYYLIKKEVRSYLSLEIRE